MTATLPRSIEIEPSILYVGTPVVLLSTVGAEGHANITPMSSAWALGDRLVLGMSEASQGCENLLRTREAVLNFPGPALHAAVERIARTTGRREVPLHKLAMGYRAEADKFALGGFSAAASVAVRAPRIAECPIQIEARLLAAHAAQPDDDGDAGLRYFELQRLRVHAHEGIVIGGTQHIDTEAWSPLLYVFRHYFGTGARLGRNFRAES